MTLVRTSRQLTVLRLIRRHGSVTRAQLGQRAKLSASQVSRLTAELIEQGLIETEREPATGRSRPADRLSLARGPHATIGLDIGGLKQQAVVANLRGETIASVEDATDLTVEREALVDYLEGLINRALAAASVDRACVLGLGVAFRAIVDPTSGVITRGPEAPFWTNSWSDLAIRRLLSERFPWERIAVDDTVRVLGLAEARYGIGAREGDFVYVFADSGIGAALMIHAKPYIGQNRVSGELGHLTIDPRGPVCACGKRGCIETYASSRALLDRATRELAEPAVSIDALEALAATGHERAGVILTEGGERLGQGLAAVLNLIGPTLVVVGGAMAVSPTYLDAAWSVARADAIEQAGRGARLVSSRLGPLAGAAGSAAMILDDVFEMRS